MINQPESGDKVLSLLRQYGWELGLQKLREEIAATPDAGARNNLLFFAGWMAVERGAYDEAEALLRDTGEESAARKWVLFAQAFLAMRQHQYPEAERLLDSVDLDAESPLLPAAVAHLRGAIAFHTSDLDRALGELRDALRLMGKDHYGTGRVLDTFGMVYAARDNFHAAEEFFRQAVALKKRWDDQPGLAVSYGNLGRLHLDWGYLDHAEECFLQDLAIARNTHDERGEALMHNGLGRIALERGHRAAPAGRTGEARRALGRRRRLARREPPRRRGPLDDQRGLCPQGPGLAPHGGGPARRRRGRAQPGRGALPARPGSPRGWRTPTGPGESSAADRADSTRPSRSSAPRSTISPGAGSRPSRSRTQWEIARLSRAAGEPRPLTTREYLAALDIAEACRRAHLVRGIDEELEDVNAEAHFARVFRRARGRGMPDETDSLISGTTETLSVLFLDIQGSTSYALDTPPEVVMMTLNQMMANVTSTLRAARCEGQRLPRRRLHGDVPRPVSRDAGRLRGAGHLPRDRGLQRAAPILGLRPFAIRIGISTGDAVLGNVGTYDLMDYTAIGTTVNLGRTPGKPGRAGLPLHQPADLRRGPRPLPIPRGLPA